MSLSKRKSKKASRASQLLNRGPIASLLHSYVESTENALMKLVKNAEPNGMLSHKEILQRERILQSLANKTKKIKNRFTRRQKLIAAASKRYHTQKEELGRHLVRDNEYYMILMRLQSEKELLRRLGINIE